jgi:hypothetical protein
MTAQKKAGVAGGITLVGIAALLALWPQIKPILDYLAPLAASERVQHVALALVAGLCLGAWLPHVVPSAWPGRRTRTIAYGCGAFLTLCLVVWMEPTRTGVFHAVIAAIASPTLAMGVAELIYLIRPQAKPESLQP